MKIASTFQHQDVQGFKFGSSPFGKPMMYSHAYFIDGLLIDTGHSNMGSTALDVFSKLPIDQILVTHFHEDHIGNLAALQDHFGCPSYASEKCTRLLKKQYKSNLAQWLTWGFPPPPNDRLQPCDTHITTSSHHFDIIATPGHSEDMVCLHEPNEGWLFSADLYVSDYIKYFIHTESMSQQIDSIKKILKLDFDVMFCGHNPQFEGAKTRLQNKLQFFENFYGRAAQLYHEGNNAKAIMKKMGLKEKWDVRIVSGGDLSAINMVKAVIRDETDKTKKIKPAI